jgi:hypothetical protein
MMMTYDASIRPSARDMLAHAWVREGGLAEDTKLQPEVGMAQGRGFWPL